MYGVGETERERRGGGEREEERRGGEIEGNKNMSPQNIPLWQVNYFELKNSSLKDTLPPLCLSHIPPTDDFTHISRYGSKAHGIAVCTLYLKDSCARMVK